jgi:GTP-binding protein
LHLSVLIEKMRREGYEMGVSRPEVIVREVDGVRQEPFEILVIDCEDEHQGGVMEALGTRKAELTNVRPDGKGRVRLDFTIPSRGLIGFRSQFLTLTSGSGIMNHIFDHYAPVIAGEFGVRQNGVLVSMLPGKVLAFALFNLQERGSMLIGANVKVYEGQIIGIHKRGNDLAVNPTKGKQLTNMRAAGTDENVILTPPIVFSLEQAIEFVNDDELVEVTPNHIRLRKRLLTEIDRKRAGRAAR